jgi:outer membrane protein OmpA-like peptidoglycan-associated protein
MPRAGVSHALAVVRVLIGPGAPLLGLILAGCGDPLRQPVDLFHNLEGGQIAAQRPPPPGAGLPYPKLGSVPTQKPVMPDKAYRSSLEAQLETERDRTERIAADTPIVVLPEAPAAASPAATPPAGETVANATMAAADASPAAAATPTPKPVASPSAPGTVSQVQVPPASAQLQIVGTPDAPAGLPDIPAAPPAPATFEGVAAEPAPTVRIIAVSTLTPPPGTAVYFTHGSVALPPSQIQVVKDVAARRGKQSIDIIGQGDADSDTPDGQEAAIALALKRADAVAKALQALHVPQSALRLGADPFGRGAVLQLHP